MYLYGLIITDFSGIPDYPNFSRNMFPNSSLHLTLYLSPYSTPLFCTILDLSTSSQSLNQFGG